MRHGIWATLDIDPTTDRGTIRKAYAARLKAMDVDADPAGFAALRAARDAALAGVAETVMAGEPAFETATIVTQTTELPPAPDANPDPDPDPDAIAFHEAIGRHFHALEALLLPGHNAPLTPMEQVAVGNHGRALLADSRLERVDFADGAERWFAEILAASIPRSDPLLEPAAAAFGWIERRNDYTLSSEALAIVERIGATRFARMLDDPKHRLHHAWVELHRSDAQPALFWNPKGPRKEVLSLIRDRFPMMESWLEPRRVADADDPGSGTIGVPVWLILFALVTGLRIFFSGTEERQPPPPPPVYVPSPAAETPTAPPMPDVVVRSDIDRYVSGLTHAPDGLIRDITEWELKVMQYYEPFDPAQCVDTGLWRRDPKLSMLWDQKRRELTGKLLSYARDESLRAPSSRFVIRGEMVGAVRQRSGMSGEDFKRSFDSEAPIADQCKTIIALRETALARPKQGNKVLRQLQLSKFGK